MYKRQFKNIPQRSYKNNNKINERGNLSGKKVIYCPLQVGSDTQIVKYGDWIKSIDQFIDILARLVKSLPSDWVLLLREHPSSDINYSKKLKKLQSDSFKVDNVTPSTDLIELSKVIVTVNSSVGFHALLKNKPVITLGHAFWGFTPLAFKANNERDVIYFFSNIESLSPDRQSISSFITYLFSKKFINNPCQNKPTIFSDHEINIIESEILKSLEHYTKKNKSPI